MLPLIGPSKSIKHANPQTTTQNKTKDIDAGCLKFREEDSRMMLKFVSGFAVLCSVWVLFNIISTVTAEKAEWFLRYDKQKKTFEINENVLPLLSALKQPITVISAIGDARVGKSTTLNFVRHIWENNENGKTDIEEVFETGDTYDPVTQGIWISIFRQRDGKSIVLLDVEGVNLGDDAVTDHLSMFTALLSSGIGLFCSDNINNHILDFLYRLPRLSAQVFKDIDVESVEKFGHLHVVIKGGQLKPPKGQSIDDFVKNALLRERSGDEEGTNNKRKVIAKSFDRQDISVSKMPRIEGGQLFRNITRVKENAVYWRSIETISRQFLNFPEKRTLHRVRIDGKALAQLAKHLVETINKKSWMEFSDSYQMSERLICNRNYDDIIAPVLKLSSLSKLHKRGFHAVEEFKNQCPLIEEVERANIALIDHRDQLVRDEERDKKRLEEEEERKRKEAEWNLLGYAKTFCVGAVGALFTKGMMFFFSDARLKQNITTLRPSKYEVLGLREVAWVWNEDAQRLGLSGEARGVIAQEVEQLYPWAVLTGHDGYKRINYAALDLMVALVSNKHIARLVNINNGDVKGKPPLPGDGRDRSVAH